MSSCPSAPLIVALSGCQKYAAHGSGSSADSYQRSDSDGSSSLGLSVAHHSTALCQVQIVHARSVAVLAAEAVEHRT
eukprot:6468302-Amphidinium_carterae.2